MDELLTTYFDFKKGNFMLANSHTQELEVEVWNSFRSGNRDALNAIFEKYVQALYSYGTNMSRDQALISDCIQDVFVELWVRRETITAKVDSIKFYLIKSVRRRILRRLSTDRRIVGQVIPDNYCEKVEGCAEFNLIQDQNLKELSDHLKKSVSHLSKAQQEAIYLKFYENLGYEQIALIMNTDVKAVYNLIAKSIFALRKFFKTHGITPE